MLAYFNWFWNPTLQKIQEHGQICYYLYTEYFCRSVFLQVMKVALLSYLDCGISTDPNYHVYISIGTNKI